MKQYIFPSILILLQMAASTMYLAEGDYRKTVYWFAAAILNIAVTF